MPIVDYDCMNSFLNIAKLPPYLPELTPTEKFCQYLKEKIIKNKLLTTISELKDTTKSLLYDITNEQVASI